MSSKQRVFSHENTTNYIEYLKNKNSIEGLKTIRSYNPDALITNFTNYDQKINYSKTYYKYAHFECNDCELENPIYECDRPNLLPNIRNRNKYIHSLKQNCPVHQTETIYQSNISYLKKEQECNMNRIEKPCNTCNDCQLKNHTLYPYAQYRDTKQEIIRLTKPLDLECWNPCKKRCPKPFEIKSKICSPFKFNKSGKLIKPLFV